jgi:hypothetical protein
MRMREIINETKRSRQDEGIGDVTLGDIGRGIGKAVSGTAKVAGGLAGATVGVGKSIAQGYRAGRDWASGNGTGYDGRYVTQYPYDRVPVDHADYADNTDAKTPAKSTTINVSTIKTALPKLSDKQLTELEKLINQRLGTLNATKQ